MSIKDHLKKIGRGKDGARALERAQAADLFGQVLDGAVSDLEIGAFCLAMRFKGETADEMAGFLDALHGRLQRWPAPAHSPLPTVVLPSYNGARKLPVLTPLLAGLLASEGLAVLWHGCATEDARTHPESQLPALEAAGLGHVRMLLQVHDELVFELPESAVAAASPVIERVMAEAALPAVMLDVPLGVDIGAGSSWGSAH